MGLLVFVLVGATTGTAVGKQWRIQTLPRVGDQVAGELAGVSCASAANCFAVGTFWDRNQTDRGLINRWNGTRWSLASTTGRRNVVGWNGISCPAATVCTAVGGPATLWAGRLRGKSWQLEHLPTVSGPVRWLRAVSCASRKFCMAVGLHGPLTNSRPLAERWNGRRWSRETVPQPRAGFGGELKGVWCGGPDACIAVGDYGSGVGRGGQKVLAERWNGRAWSVVRAPNPNGDLIELNGISCTSKSWCEAAGDYSRSADGTFFGLVEQWNGRQWRLEHVAGPAARPNDVRVRGDQLSGTGSLHGRGRLGRQERPRLRARRAPRQGHVVRAANPQPAGARGDDVRRVMRQWRRMRGGRIAAGGRGVLSPGPVRRTILVGFAGLP